MKKIGVRDFQRNFYTIIKDAPFVVTSKGKDLIVVSLPGQNVVTSPKIVENVVTITPKMTRQLPNVTTNQKIVTTSKPTKKTTRKDIGDVPDRKSKSILFE